MKRLIVILSCLSVFYAGAVWALEGCRDFIADVSADHHAERASAYHHQDAGAVPHHSHSDPSKVHCPNALGEFLISARVALTSDAGYFTQVAAAGESINEFLSVKISGGFGGGPPGMVYSKDCPRHLLLSVIRV